MKIVVKVLLRGNIRLLISMRSLLIVHGFNRGNPILYEYIRIGDQTDNMDYSLIYNAYYLSIDVFLLGFPQG